LTAGPTGVSSDTTRQERRFAIVKLYGAPDVALSQATQTFRRRVLV
jgi:hypothetical protein